MRLPVAAKIALHSAGANGGTPTSPIPPGTASLSTMWTWVSRGAAFMRATWKSLKLLCWARPSRNVISPYSVELSAMTAAPST